MTSPDTSTSVVTNKRDRSVLNTMAITFFALGIIGGGTAIGIGVWTLVERNYTSPVLGSDLMTVSAWMLAIAGMIAVVISFLAIGASCCASMCAMYAYCILQGLVLTMLIISCILAVVFKAHIGGSPEEIHRYMRDTIYDDYGVRLDNSWNRKITDSWDTTQHKLVCCAVEDNSWDIYGNSEWYKIQPIIPEAGVKPFVPSSCCTTFDNGEYLDELHCQTNMDGPPGSPASPIENVALNYRGCFRASKDFASHQSDFLIGTSLAVAFLCVLPALIFGIFMAMRGIPAMNQLSERHRVSRESFMYPSGGSFDGMHGYNYK